MTDVVKTQLLQVGNHTYRMRTQPIGGKPLPQQVRQQDDDEEAAAAAAWEEEHVKGEAEIATAEDLIDESLISQEGSSLVTCVSVDPQVWNGTVIVQG